MMIELKQLKMIDDRITDLDAQIESEKGVLKGLKDDRENAVQELREKIRNLHQIQMDFKEKENKDSK